MYQFCASSNENTLYMLDRIRKCGSYRMVYEYMNGHVYEIRVYSNLTGEQVALFYTVETRIGNNMKVPAWSGWFDINRHFRIADLNRLNHRGW